MSAEERCICPGYRTTYEDDDGVLRCWECSLPATPDAGDASEVEALAVVTLHDKMLGLAWSCTCGAIGAGATDPVQKAAREHQQAHLGDWLAAREAAARAESAEADCDALRAGIKAMRRVVDDEVANLADDGARLSHSVVRRMEAVLAPLLPGDGR